MKKEIKWLLRASLALMPILATQAQEMPKTPLVNQAGYNLNEAKHFVCYGAPNNTPFSIRNKNSNEVVYQGKILGGEGWFSDFNPANSTDEYVIEVKDRGESVPFWIADHLMEKISSKLAYDFFIDARGSEDPVNSNEAKVYSGGPTRDCGAFGLESPFEILFYASNPALFDNWTGELGDPNRADLIDLILWHGKFAYHHVDFNQKVANRHGTLGYPGEPRMEYDYWNTLDQIAPLCAAYHSFLKPHLDEETYRKYRQVCLDKWTQYDRHKVVRYWTYSVKWVDPGFQEFNEMGNVYGQSVFSNLFMYLCEKNEPDGNPTQFLNWAKESARDIIANWDFNNPRHMWWIRNGEHITPQALAFFLMVAPDEAPEGTREKLVAWGNHMKQRTNNAWRYRSHSETEMAHSRTKELGGAPALGGSMFAVGHLTDDNYLRNLGWSQVDFVFGANPSGAHFSNKSDERLEINGWWDGVEVGWPHSHPNGYGKLGLVRGTLDGSPLNQHFPEMANQQSQDKNGKDNLGNFAYATEGWGISNRGWMATLTFSTLGSHKLEILDLQGNQVSQVRPNMKVCFRLKAALNQNWDKVDRGWIEVKLPDGKKEKIVVVETGNNTGIFEAEYVIPKLRKGAMLEASYGYFGFEKKASVNVVS